MRRRERKKRNWWMGDVRSRDVGEKLRLVPYWERGLDRSHNDTRHEIIVDPGPAFGGGDHPTTLMALQLLESTVEEAGRKCDSPTMLDVGTGTGVLAIAGKILGSGFTVGLDIDAAAVLTARRNLTLNGFPTSCDGYDPVELMVGSADALRGEFAIVAANLAAPTLLRITSALQSLSAHFLILSGIAEPMAEQVMQTYQTTDLRLISRLDNDGWHAALFGKT